MKKITSFLSLLLLFCVATGSTCAQSFKALSSFDASQALTDYSSVTEGNYVLKNNGRGWYLKYNLLAGNMSVSSTIDTNSAEAGLFVFHIKPTSTSGKYTIETAVEGYYMPETTWGGNSTPVSTESPYEFTFETADNGVCIKSDNSQYFNGNSDSFVGWNTNGGNSVYQLIPVTPATDLCRVVTTKVTLDGTEVSSSKAIYKDGTTVSTPSVSHSNYITLSSTESTTVSENATEITVTATKGTAPVTFGTWYAMNTRNGDNFYIKAASSSTTDAHYNISSAATPSDFNNSIWRFEESGLGVKIYNKGTGQYLKCNGTSAATTDATGSVFYFSDVVGDRSWANFTLNDGTANAVFGNHVGWSSSDWSNHNIGNWNGGTYDDDGSHFKVIAVDADETLLALAKTCYKNSPNTADATYLTAGTDFSANTSAIDAAASLDALDAAYKTALETITPDLTAYYRIKNCNTSQYITTANVDVDKDGTLVTAYNKNSGMDRQLSRVSDGALVPQLFKFVSADGGKYRLICANHGIGLGISNGSPVDIPTKDEYATTTLALGVNTSFHTGGEKYIKIMMKFGDNNEHLLNAYGGTAQSIIQNWDSETDEGCYWKFEKITSIPVTIGETGFTGVCYPFAVQIPDDSSVKAYYGKELTDGAMLLTELTDGIIPANQGVILYNADGATSVNLAITTTDNTISNALSGTTARRINFDASSTYGLGKTSTDEAAFMVNTATAVPANKPYIEKTSQSVSSISLSFGKTDGIDSATTVDHSGKSVKYFDLNGRPVLYPVHGLYITDKGQKVLVP